jgi:uncharacterized membrane protein YecN with MAPEG domain
MSIGLICIALLAFLCLALGFNVSMARNSSGTIYGCDINPENNLYKAQRAHGNTTEYAPILAVIIFALIQSPQPGWVMGAIVLVTFFRYLLAAGILLPASMAKPHPMRFIGALGTYITGFVLIAALFIQAVGI